MLSLAESSHEVHHGIVSRQVAVWHVWRPAEDTRKGSAVISMDRPW